MIKDESDPSNRAGLWLIRGSKAGSTEYTFFDDITYSTGKKEKMLIDFWSLYSAPATVLWCGHINEISQGTLSRRT